MFLATSHSCSLMLKKGDRPSKRSSRKESHHEDRSRRSSEKDGHERSGRDSERRRKERDLVDSDGKGLSVDTKVSLPTALFCISVPTNFLPARRQAHS